MTNMTTSNISVLDETSVPPIIIGRRQTYRTSASLNSFQINFIVMCHTMKSIPRANFIEINSTSMGRLACWGLSPL